MTIAFTFHRSKGGQRTWIFSSWPRPLSKVNAQYLLHLMLTLPLVNMKHVKMHKHAMFTANSLCQAPFVFLKSITFDHSTWTWTVSGYRLMVNTVASYQAKSWTPCYGGRLVWEKQMHKLKSKPTLFTVLGLFPLDWFVLLGWTTL